MDAARTHYDAELQPHSFRLYQTGRSPERSYYSAGSAIRQAAAVCGIIGKHERNDPDDSPEKTGACGQCPIAAGPHNG